MSDKKELLLPSPIVDAKEKEAIKKLCERYEKLVKPGILVKTGTWIADFIPQPIKSVGRSAGKVAKEVITERELYINCINIVTNGFAVLEKYAAQLTINEKSIVNKIDTASKEVNITSIDEICMARGYDIAKLVNKHKKVDFFATAIEGAGTGALGFTGLAFNLVLSTFLYYRTVQSVAMYYGYDVKNDPSELIIASEVFMNALSPNSQGTSGVSGTIGKIMVMTEVTTIKQLSKKTWEEMAKHGGIALIICQMRALANSAARKALEKTGQKGLEESLFKGIFEQIGRRLTKKTVGKAVPVAGAVIGALFDTAQMKTVLEYADIFYNKRFLIEKEARINTLLGITDFVDADIVEVSKGAENVQENLPDQ